MSRDTDLWSDAAVAASLFAVDRAGTRGISVRSGAGGVRDRWLELLMQLLPAKTFVRKLPLGISDGRLLGGINLVATLQSGRPVAERGLLAEIDGGILLAAMAERLPASTAAHLNAALDSREVAVERDGLSLRLPSCFGVVAFDEGIDDEHVAASLGERLAFHIDIGALSLADVADLGLDRGDIELACSRLDRVTVPSTAVEAICFTAVSLGVASLRAPLLALRAARAAAALDDENSVQPRHLELAARLVLAPRATTLPASPQEQTERPLDQEPGNVDDDRQDHGELDDLVLEAAKAAIPPDLLKRLQEGGLSRQRSQSSGRQGLAKAGPTRGRPIGTRRGDLRAGARLNVLETLRAAAPWQPLRRRAEARHVRDMRLLIRKDDFRLTRFKQKSATSTIFVVDASGSSALQRLAEVKGAVELLLADCYVRRDEVALIAFRGKSAELILPPTRSLARAKRSLGALAGGGGTPLSAAIVSATTLALAVRSKGHSPTIVLMTDGRANVSRDGSAGRSAAEAEAQAAARQLRATGIPAVVIDTSPRPHPQAEKIATEMRARYVALPYADAAWLSRAVQANMQGA